MVIAGLVPVMLLVTVSVAVKAHDPADAVTPPVNVLVPPSPDTKV
jgi:hypothetical protein